MVCTACYWLIHFKYFKILSGMISIYRFKNICYLSSLVHLNMYIYKHMYIISEYVYIMYICKYVTHKIYLTSVVIAQINYVKSSTNYWRKRIIFKNYKSSIGITLDLNFDAYNLHCKPNVETLYIHAKSNHPANILKQLPRTKVKFPVDLVTFTEEILNGKLHFLC